MKDRLAVLGYIPGSFNVWEAKEMLGLFEWCGRIGYVIVLSHNSR